MRPPTHQLFFRKFNFIHFLFKAFVNTIGTWGSKNTKNEDLISTRKKIRTKSVHTGNIRTNPYTMLKEVEEIRIFEKKNLTTLLKYSKNVYFMPKISI